MIKSVLVFPLLFFSFSLSAQLQTEGNPNGSRRKTNAESNTHGRREKSPTNFFQSYGVTIFAEFMTTKVHKVDRFFFYGTNQNGAPLVDKITAYETGSGITLMTMTYEPRYNLYNYLDKASVSVSAPLAFSFNFVTNNTSIGSLTIPVIFSANYGMHSTYNNKNKFGVHVGVGYQGIVGGIFPLGDSEMGAQFWTQPVVRTGMKFPFQNQNCFIDAYYGFGKKHLSTEAYDHATNEATYTTVYAKFYAKLVFGWLINYD